MSVLISETIERRCCDPQRDLKKYEGAVQIPDLARTKKIWFCVHCGQYWHIFQEPGELEAGWTALRIKETI